MLVNRRVILLMEYGFCAGDSDDPRDADFVPGSSVGGSGGRRSKRLHSVLPDAATKRSRVSIVDSSDDEGSDDSLFLQLPKSSRYSFCHGRVTSGLMMLSIDCFPGNTSPMRGAGTHHESGPASGDVTCGTYASVGGTVAFEPGPSSGKSRERTQHARPSVGLERSVLHNEWEKGNYYWHYELRCFISMSFFVCPVGLCLILVGFFSGSLGYPSWSGVPVFLTSAGFRAGCCSTGTESETGR